MGTFLGTTLFPPLAHLREGPEFFSFIATDKGLWPRFMHWHGWLPGLSAVGRGPLGVAPG